MNPKSQNKMQVQRKASSKSVSESKTSLLLDVEPSLYWNPPEGTISMDQFEQFAFDRFQVLQQIDLLDFGTSESSESPSIKVLDLCRKYGITDTLKDNYSHFTLRLAFCKTDEWRRWFCRLETMLFKFRFEMASNNVKSAFLKKLHMHMELADMDEVESLWNRIKSVPDAPSQDEMHFIYKVPFHLALDLIGRRRVFVTGGTAYVPFKHVISLVVSRFRANLSKQLATAFRASHRSDNPFEERFEPLMNSLRSNQLTDTSFTGDVVPGQVTLESLDQLASESFPLCMHHSFVMLKRNHHLKHEGRMQFGLFLKGIGLSLDDALKFWRDSFYPRTQRDKFDKVYAYNVRHNYGKEGKRANYTPYGCMKIINTPAPGADTFHGRFIDFTLTYRMSL